MGQTSGVIGYFKAPDSQDQVSSGMVVIHTDDRIGKSWHQMLAYWPVEFLSSGNMLVSQSTSWNFCWFGWLSYIHTGLSHLQGFPIRVQSGRQCRGCMAYINYQGRTKSCAALKAGPIWSWSKLHVTALVAVHIPVMESWQMDFLSLKIKKILSSVKCLKKKKKKIDSMPNRQLPIKIYILYTTP